MIRNNDLEQIRNVKPLIHKLSNIREEYWRYYEPEIDLRKTPPIIIAIVGIILWRQFYKANSYIVGELYTHSNGTTLFGLIGGFIFACVVINLVVNKVSSKQIKSRLARTEKRRDEILKEEAILTNNINQSIVPVRYCQPYIINKLEFYIANRRADSLKESINLYEQERHNQEYMNRLRSIEETQEDISQEVDNLKSWVIFDVFTRR